MSAYLWTVPDYKTNNLLGDDVNSELNQSLWGSRYFVLVFPLLFVVYYPYTHCYIICSLYQNPLSTAVSCPEGAAWLHYDTPDLRPPGPASYYLYDYLLLKRKRKWRAHLVVDILWLYRASLHALFWDVSRL